MPGWTNPPTNISDSDLDACIKLVRAVSYRAKSYDLAKSNVGKRIRDRVQDNQWHTWWHQNGGGIDACCFFQLMHSRNNNYAMCIGFDKHVFPMQTDADCLSFLNTVAGNGNGDGLLRDCVKNVLQVPFVLVVDQPLTSSAASYNQRLNTLFAYMQTNTPGSNWSLAQVEQNSDDDFWGGSGLNVWQLNIT
jgi:hypothetical protein